MTVKQLLRQIDSAELAEWQAYNMLEPFGNEEYGASWRNALSISSLGNILAKLHRAKGTLQLEDFMPKRMITADVAAVGEPEKQDPEVIKALLIGTMRPTIGPRRKTKRDWGKRKRPRKS
jgi:hypothetical protein